MSRSAVIKQNQGYLSILPVGVIMAWHRDLLPADGSAALPPGWVACNGQTLDDEESPLHGIKIPELNQDAGTKNGGYFLRGSLHSGDFQPDAMQSHTHTESRSGHRHSTQLGNNTGTGPDDWGAQHSDEHGGNWGQAQSSYAKVQLGDPTGSTGGNPRHGKETRPANMSVIWIMKVKQVAALSAIPAVLAADRAPDGSIYVDGSGNVGVGTSTPQGRLDVAGPIRRNGQPLTQSGTAKHGDVINVPTGTRNDWSLFLSPRDVGREETGSEGDNALLEIRCYEQVESATAWKVYCRYKYNHWSDRDGVWYDNGQVNYLLVAK